MAEQNISSKCCSRCEQLLNASAFNKDKSTRDGLQHKCRACQKEMRRDWYLRNRDREIAKTAQWVKENPDRAREKDRRRAIARPGRTTLQSKKWRHDNPQRAAEFSRKWKSANPEAVREMGRRAYARNPDKFLAKSHRRRVKDPETGAIFTEKDIKRIYAAQKGLCGGCRVKLGGSFERDHIVPLALEGTNDPKNIQLLCVLCNKRKSDKHPVDFMREQGFLL